MYDVSQIKAGLIGLVGWRQNVDSSGQQLSSLTLSSSGLYFNDEHPMLTLDNLISIAPDFSRLTYTAWNSGTTYAIGDKVSLSGTNYIAIAASTNQTPPNATYWISLFEKWLKEKTEAGIIKGLNAWMDEKFEDRTARNLLSNSVEFAATGLIGELDANSGQVVGREILPVISRNLSIKINRIGLQFDTNQDITVYLFNSRQPAYVQTQTITYTGDGGLEWYTLSTPWTLDGEGAYYLVYDQSDITGQSINGVHEYHFQTYGRYGRTSFSMGKYFRSTSFSVGGDVSGLWDISSNSYTLETNYGLNLDMSVECDYTSLFLEQKNQFKTVIAKSVAMLLLREMAYNPNVNVNRNQANVTREQLLYEIDGDSQGRKGGMQKQLDEAIDGAKMDTTGMDKVCLPCKRWASKWRVA